MGISKYDTMNATWMIGTKRPGHLGDGRFSHDLFYQY